MESERIIGTDRYVIEFPSIDGIGRSRNGYNHNQINLSFEDYPNVDQDMEKAVKKAHQIRAEKRRRYIASCKERKIEPLPEEIWALRGVTYETSSIDGSVEVFLQLGKADYAWVDAFMFAPVRDRDEDQKYKIQCSDGTKRWPRPNERALASGLYTIILTNGPESLDLILGLRGGNVSSIRDSYGTFGGAFYDFSGDWKISPPEIFSQGIRTALNDLQLDANDKVVLHTLTGISRTAIGVFYYIVDSNQNCVFPSRTPTEHYCETFGDRMIHFMMKLKMETARFMEEQKQKILDKGKYKDVISINLRDGDQLGKFLDNRHHQIATTLEGQLFILGISQFGEGWLKERKWVQ